MPNLRTEGDAHDEPETPDGFDGHIGIGFDCLRCGARVKGGSPRWWRLHVRWHAELEQRLDR